MGKLDLSELQQEALNAITHATEQWVIIERTLQGVWLLSNECRLIALSNRGKIIFLKLQETAFGLCYVNSRKKLFLKVLCERYFGDSPEDKQLRKQEEKRQKYIAAIPSWCRKKAVENHYCKEPWETRMYARALEAAHLWGLNI